VAAGAGHEASVVLAGGALGYVQGQRQIAPASGPIEREAQCLKYLSHR
jgi:hypothetical protein